ncbi:zinc finger protein 354A-like [Sabethes cyaneus]|uniref:zinc finger protein 354A-like n=1 Tax=Sabethes cyaneus TaxID=53552 RepID=UPI00237EA074|nr:zinc finger protein 354A-like [Sabethes cyaneus]
MNSCRLCLKDFLLLQESFNIHTLKEKLQLVFSFEITAGKQFPEVICPACVETVCQFYKYAYEVQQNQLKLYSAVEDELMQDKPLQVIPSPEQVFTMVTDLKTESTDTIVLKEDEKNPLETAPKAAKFEKNLINRYLNMVCDICKEDLFTYQKLEVHFKKYHGKRCYISCCGQKLTNDQLISDHLRKHMSRIKRKDTSTSWEKRVIFAFGSILTDFKRDLEGYEPLPNMDLALKGDTYEQQKMYDVQDYLVQIYFSLNCELCGAKINNQDDRRFHFRQNHPKEKYYVSCCSQRFSTRISIMRHMNRHWKHVTNKNVAGKSTSSKHDLGDSVEPAFHINNLKWQRELHSTYDPLINEFREELIAGGFNPPVKPPEFKTEEEQKLLHQMQDFLIAKHSPLNCELCGTEISTYSGRREHFRVGHPKQNFFIQCCGRKLIERRKIVMHLLRHKKGLPITQAHAIRNIPADMYEKHEHDDAIIEAYYKMDCEICDYTGTSYLGLRAHFQKDHREEGFFITCCNRRFKTKFHILEHIAGHQKPGAVKCDQCEATFSTERKLKAHMNRKHVSEDEKLYRCDHCVESFATKNLLLLHSYKHEMVTCDICGAEMKRCSLRVHKINIHKLGEEIVCHVCAKVFHSKHMFNKHYRASHLGIRKKYKRKSRAKKRLPVADEPTTAAPLTYAISCYDSKSLTVL